MANLKEEREIIGAAIALGADIPAVPGSTFFELQSFGGDYDLYSEKSLGFYSSKSDAVNAMRRLLYEDFAMRVTNTPWGERTIDAISDGIVPSDQWYIAKKKWFEARSLKTIAIWFEKKAAFEGDAYVHYSLRIIERSISTPIAKYSYSLPKEVENV